jgi:SpoVK/Ycf46/Vps4 family AAA+-type ATPase
MRSNLQANLVSPSGGRVYGRGSLNNLSRTSSSRDNNHHPEESTANEFIPQRFRQVVLLHLFKNLHSRPDESTPLLLGIHGPSGEGKTFQCLRVLQEIDSHIVTISGGELESRDAGEPALLIRESYIEAANHRRARRPVAIVFNDIDAAIGDWGQQVQYTVNRQTIFGELMHLADFPNQVRGTPVARVPIILTGNDFSRLYAPLRRLGRMVLFEWKPSEEEKYRVISELYPELSEEDAWKLLHAFAGQSISFFSHLKAELDSKHILSLIERYGTRESFARLLGGGLAFPSTPISLEELLELGEKVVNSTVVRGHLGD